MKAVVAAFNQEKALVGAFSVITNFQMELFEALIEAAPLRFPQPWEQIPGFDLPHHSIIILYTQHLYSQGLNVIIYINLKALM